MRLTNSLRLRVAAVARWLNRTRYRLLNVKVGHDVFISLGAHIDTSYPDLIEIEDDVYITRGAILIAHDQSVWQRGDTLQDDGRGYIKICRKAFIGSGAIILRNVTVGENAIVAAGSVVTRDVPPNSIVAGNPARVVKEFTPRVSLTR
jgi:acetyltransferase-like isoleucine patch superfamily enzyme